MRQPLTGVRGGRPAAPPRAQAAAPPATPGRDPQLGQIFSNMRAALRLTREALARRLATTPGTIDDFEAGAISALPHWRETVRIVQAYCEALRLDPNPILWRIQNHLRAPGAQADPPTQPSNVRPPRAMLRRDNPDEEEPSDRSRRWRSVRRRRTFFAWSAPFALAGAVVYFVHVAPGPAYRAAAQLPAPLDGMARAGVDQLLLIAAPRRDGLRWIDVGDPKLRKVDKLQTSKL